MTNTFKDKEIMDAVKNQQKPSGMLDKESFWHEFKGKAQGIKQDAEVREPLLFISGWAKIAACFIFSICLFSLLFMYIRAEETKETPSVIEDYEIYSKHSGVLIIEDEDESGTILWITGLDESHTGELL